MSIPDDVASELDRCSTLVGCFQAAQQILTRAADACDDLAAQRLLFYHQEELVEQFSHLFGAHLVEEALQALDDTEGAADFDFRRLLVEEVGFAVCSVLSDFSNANWRPHKIADCLLWPFPPDPWPGEEGWIEDDVRLWADAWRDFESRRPKVDPEVIQPAAAPDTNERA